MTTRRALLPALLVCAAAQARAPFRDVGVLRDVVDAYANAVDVDDPAVRAARYPGRTLADFDRDGDGVFGAALDDAFADARLAVLQFNHDDLDFDGDGLPGLVELDCVIDGTRLDPASAQTFPGVDDGDLDGDGDGLANGAEVARGLDPNDPRDARACVADDQEPNEDEGGAHPLPLVGGTAVADGRLCLADVDWYAVEIPAGATLVVDLEFVHADGDLDARLLDPAGALYAVAASATDNERFEVPDAAPGAWRIGISGARNDYTLRVVAVPRVGCVADASEAAPGDDAPLLATHLEPGDVPVEVDDRSICPGDDDWYSFDVGEGDGVLVRVYQLGNPTGLDGDLDFVLHGPGLPGVGDVLLPNAFGGQGTPEAPFYLEFFAEPDNRSIRAGRYYLEVAGLAIDPAQWGDYRVTVGVERLRRLCLPDLREPDGDAPTALAALPGFGRDEGGVVRLVPEVWRQLDGTLCIRDEDRFTLDLAAGDSVDLELQREAPVEGDVLMELRGPDGAVIRAARSANASLPLSVEVPVAGAHEVRLDGINEVETFYALRVRRRLAPVPCVADADEPNDARAAATAVVPGIRPDLTLCGADGDEDWYAFEVPGLSNVTVSLQFLQAQADLDLDVYRDGVGVALNAGQRQGHTRGDGETVMLSNLRAGRYLARVTGFSPDGAGGGNAPYALDVDVQPRQYSCDDDPDESNDEPANATVLDDGPFVREQQWLCLRIPPEEDWVRIHVPANEDRVLGADFVLFDDGDLFLEVYDTNGILRATTSRVSRNQSKQCVVFPASADDRDFDVRVVPLDINTVLDDDERLDYRLHYLRTTDCEAFGPPSPGVFWPRVR